MKTVTVKIKNRWMRTLVAENKREIISSGKALLLLISLFLTFELIVAALYILSLL